MKTIVITGSTRGIGRGLAQEFLARGCQVMVSGRSPDTVAATVEDLGSRNDAERVAGLACDITDPDQLDALWTAAVAAFGTVDVWINNAGVSARRAKLWDQPLEDIRMVLDTNLYGAILGVRTAIKGMLAQGSGQVWLVEGFGSGNEAQDGMAAYGASKRAIRYLRKALLAETKDTPVQICTLSPGIVATDLLVSDYDKTSPEWAKAKKIFNILGDKVETVTPWLADNVLAADETGAKVVWLTKRKAAGRFMSASFNKRDVVD